MTCPCEACKEARLLSKLQRLSKRNLADWHKRQLQEIEGRIAASKDATWTSADGRCTRVQDMNTAHLFFAIAKGCRGEYPPSYARSTIHLENEALRRLIAGVR